MGAAKGGSELASTLFNVGSTGAGVASTSTGTESTGQKVYDGASAVVGLLGPVGGGISAVMNIAEIAHSDEPIGLLMIDLLA